MGETPYYKHGQSPDSEFKLVLKAILAVCEDAGLDPRDIDGFSSYANDRSEPTRLASALGVKRLKSATMQWGGGGGDFGHAAVITEEIASLGIDGLGFGLHSDIVVPYIERLGNEAQKAQWLPRCATGEVITAIVTVQGVTSMPPSNLRDTTMARPMKPSNSPHHWRRDTWPPRADSQMAASTG